MSSDQLGADVTPELKKSFKAYSRSLGVSESAVLHLLLRRELRKSRLPDLEKVRPAKRGGSRFRLTARPRATDVEAAFLAHIQRLGLDPATAIATLAQAEVDEEWLASS